MVAGAPALKSYAVTSKGAASLSRLHAKEARMGALLVVPTVCGIVVFTAGPIVASFALSLFRWNVINHPAFIGLQNYRELVHDSVVLHAFLTTAIMAALIVTLQIGLGLTLAIAVERRSKRLRKIYRAAFFFPLMTSAASISIVAWSITTSPCCTCPTSRGWAHQWAP
jgi:multiple sugar transport system permease protein